MKIKANIRAGKQTRGGDGLKSNATETEVHSSPVQVYVPPVSRCVGI